jgi:asparagine synthase (glutamine-hydrolysing)
MNRLLLHCSASDAPVSWAGAMPTIPPVRSRDGRAEAIAECDATMARIADGPTALAAESLLVAADGWLVARDELAARIRAKGGTVPTGHDAAAWVRAGYAALGPELFRVLEGEYAVLVWDATARTLWIATDVTGRRAVYWRANAEHLIAGTSAREVARLAKASALDPQVLAERATLFVGSARRTAWRDVHRVGGGDLLRWQPGFDVPQVEALRRYAPFIGGGTGSSEAAARELGELLEQAARDRMAPAGLTTVWMSGGYDSTSVFASGRKGLGGAAQRLEPVSISYPVGSSGREDELILDAANHWSAPVHWLTMGDSDQLADAFEAHILDMDDAFAHLYGYGMQALARRSNAAESGVGLCGYGGDAVFYGVPDAYVRDLVARGRVAEAWREFRAFGMGGRRGFLQRAILPTLPVPVARLLARGAKVGMPPVLFQQRPAEWVRGPAVDAGAIAEVARSGGVARRVGESADAWTIRFMLESPFFQKVQEALQAVARLEGVSHRSPIMDRRVVDFMAQRPRQERAADGETKRLLRAAMRDRLPDSVTGPRVVRTGVPSDVLESAAAATIRRFAESGPPERLMSLGVVDGPRFEAAQARYLQGENPSGMLGLHLLATVTTERWLRRQG